jgi:hypothetical protein
MLRPGARIMTSLGVLRSPPIIRYLALGAGLRTNMMKVSNGVTPHPSPGAGIIMVFLFYFITHGPSSVKLINFVAVTLPETFRPCTYIYPFQRMRTQTSHDIRYVTIK